MEREFVPDFVLFPAIELKAWDSYLISSISACPWFRIVKSFQEQQNDF